MIIFISYCLLVAAVLYGLFILSVLIKWKSIPPFIVESVDSPSVEILVPCKNKGATISACIESLIHNSKPADIITMIDDGSSDQSAKHANDSLRAADRLISLDHSQGKKRALNLAIRQSTRDIILTTDADCIASNRFVENLSTSLTIKKCDLALGPVFIHQPKNLLEWFQQFDLLATMAASQVGHACSLYYSGSGAHMGYFRKTYNKLQPYEDNYAIASGDDIFFIEKIIKSGKSTYFIKHPESYVLTQAESTWSALWRQRVRWAGKTKHYKQNGLKVLWLFLGGVLTCYCVSILLVAFHLNLWIFFTAWFIKGIVDYLLVRQVASFYKLNMATLAFFISLMIYPFFTMAVGIRSMFGRLDKWD